MTFRRCVVAASVLVATIFSVAFLSCKAKERPAGPAGEVGLVVLIPASLAAPVQGVTAEFEKLYPGARVKMEVAGSLDGARAIADQGRRADIFASSDYSVIETLMMPKAATWYLKFARNYVQLAFTDKSQFADTVNSSNWYKCLAKPGVKIGCVDPESDPLGYRGLMAVQLAAGYYGRKGLAEELKKNCVPNKIKTDGGEIVKMIMAGELDYAFSYRSVIKQNGLRFIALPPEVDLSSGSFADDYKQAKVEIAGPTPGSKRTVVGEPIVYAVTIPTAAEQKEAAINYLKVMLGPAGHQIFEKNAQKQLDQCEASDKTKAPGELSAFFK